MCSRPLRGVLADLAELLVGEFALGLEDIRVYKKLAQIVQQRPQSNFCHFLLAVLLVQTKCDDQGGHIDRMHNRGVIHVRHQGQLDQ